MTAVLDAVRLGKQYGRRWALSDCTLQIPTGRVVGLVGPNGAGKTTLLHSGRRSAAADLRLDRGSRRSTGGEPGTTRQGRFRRPGHPDLLKVGLLGGSAMVVAGVFSLMVTWWSAPFDRVNMNRLTPAMFGERGITPVGYAALGFAVGVTAGMLIRRTLPAMATTLVAFVGARLATTYWVRPHLRSPLRTVSPFQLGGGSGGTPTPGDWVVSSQTINAAGKVIGANGGIGSSGNVGFDIGRDGTLNFVGVGLCPNRVPAPTGGNPGPPNAQAAFQQCADKLGIREVLHYQPAGRYWAFQWYETAIFIVLALALVGFCLWWIRRRRDRRAFHR